jgi:hypothetical protein
MINQLRQFANHAKWIIATHRGSSSKYKVERNTRQRPNDDGICR